MHSIGLPGDAMREEISTKSAKSTHALGQIAHRLNLCWWGRNNWWTL